jgi:hypothetical protein
MAIALSIIGIAFAAFGVWLTVRIVSRRERWAKKVAAVLVAALVLYPFSWGPFLLATSYLDLDIGQSMTVGSVYIPLMLLARESAAAKSVMKWYVLLWVDDGNCPVGLLY